MKNKKRFIKAIVVVLVVGVGCILQLEEQTGIYQRVISREFSTNQIESNTDSMSAGSSKFMIYTRNIIREGVEYLISGW